MFVTKSKGSFRRRRHWVLVWGTVFLICMGGAQQSRSLAPHEILLLVNEHSADSLEIANHYIDQRQIPMQNVVWLDLPAEVPNEKGNLHIDNFRRWIYEPVVKAVQQRDLDHVLAFVYSADFPIRLKPSKWPFLSLMGATLLEGKTLDPDMIQKATYVSPFYAGPSPGGTGIKKAQSFRAMRKQMDEYVYPSFMLGYTGMRGNSVDEVLKCLEVGHRSDRTHPGGKVYFVTNENVRSKCRAWQFKVAEKIVSDQGGRVTVVDKPPRRKRGIMGLLMGTAAVKVDRVGTFAPGAYADHLTSFGATFHIGQQTKITRWIRAGATASAGTVVEPGANWRKFPSAFLFAHYTAGATMIESLYQATRCPLQLLMLGDPLACPWQEPVSVTLMPFESVFTNQSARFAVDVRTTRPAAYSIELFVDGVSVGTGKGNWVQVPIGDLEDGFHEIRAAVHSKKGLDAGAFDTAWFRVARRGLSVEVKNKEQSRSLKPGQTYTVRCDVQGGQPEMIVLRTGQRIAAASSPADPLSVKIPPHKLGTGPVWLQAEAVFEDGARVRGKPWRVRVQGQ